ncbi:MAG: cytochrome P450 [Bdellovibrionales bacterium]
MKKMMSGDNNAKLQSLTTLALDYRGVLEIRITPNWLRATLGQLARLPDFLGGAKFTRFHDVLPPTFVLIADPGITRDILLNTKDYIRPYGEMADIIGEHSLFVQDDSQAEEHESWKLSHKAMVGAFTPQFIHKNYQPIIRDELDRMDQRWQRKLDGAEKNTISVQEDLDVFAIRTGFRAFLQADLSDEQSLELRPVFANVLKRVDHQAERGHLLALIQPLVNQRRDAQSGDSLVDRLLLAQKEHGLPDEWVWDQLITVLFAAQETTRYALSMTLVELGRNSDWQIYLQREQRNDHAEAFVKEVLRLYPPVPMIPRVTNQAVTAGGYKFAANNILQILPRAQHLNPEVWGHDAIQFRPRRFLSTEVDKYALCPFGGGMRLCLGMAMAMTELKMFVLDVARRWDVYGPNETPQINMGPGVMTLGEPLVIKLKRRTEER